MRTRTYTLEPGDVLTRGKCRVMVLRTTGCRAVALVLRNRYDIAPAERTIRTMYLQELATLWEVAA